MKPDKDCDWADWLVAFLLALALTLPFPSDARPAANRPAGDDAGLACRDNRQGDCIGHVRASPRT